MAKYFKRSVVFFTALVFSQLKLNAQDNPINKITISSPTAASLGKFGDIPVNYHTGIPQINIPIYTVSAGSLSLPISLSYHAAGLKVQEPAGWVGAGWALNAGGVITRTVIGAPDEKGTNNGGTESHGHFSDYGYNNYINGTNNNNTEDWDAFSKGYKDGEPDLFFFNFGGYSGKFYFRDDRTPVIVPEADLKIEPNYNPSGTNISIQSFIVTTPDGVKYYFGNTPGLTGTAPVEITKPVTEFNGVSSANTISSWYLNKIATADDQFAITLTYQTESYGYHTLSMFPIAGDAYMGQPTTFGATHGYELIKNIVQGVRLSQISYANGSINFVEGSSARTDLSDVTASYYYDAVNQSAKPLGSIQITDGTTILRKFNFAYSYFTDNTTALPQDIANFAPNLFTDKQRLRLDQVQEISGDGTITKPAYSFTYFSEQVPRRISFGIDHWGFNNGITTNTTPIPSYLKFGSNAVVSFSGAARDSHWPAMRAGTLQQINYPTGGYSLFEFETNNIYNTSTTTSYSNVNLASLYVLQYGQSNITMSGTFTSNGTAMNIAFNNGNNYSASFSIVNNSNTVVYSTTIGNGQVLSNNPLTLAQGTYTATLSVPSGSSGGAQATITQWQTLQNTVTNTVTVGGNRIKTITHNDGVTANDMVTSYSYLGDNGQSSGILYSRPVYVGVIRNDLIQNVGLYGSTFTGFTPYGSANGCTSMIDATYFKSPSSIRPMANTQGNHLGYSQVKVSQTGNGYSFYKYYGTTNVPVWQQNNGDIATTVVNAAGCDANAPNFPYPPVQFDYLRGELRYEAHYSQSGQMLKEKSYVPTFVNDPIKTPAFLISQDITTQYLLATKYDLTTAHKTQTQVTETSYDANGVSFTTTQTSYNESPFHHEVTRTNTVNSKGEALESKKKYAFDFRISTCDNISDGYSQYNTDCTSCLAAKNTAMSACSGNSQCLTNAYVAYLNCLATSRTNWVSYRRTNFTDPTNTFQTYHNNAKINADAELKPILQLQDNYQNSPIENTQWKNGNLLGASFSRFDYSTVPSGKAYLNKIQAINLAAASSTFTNAATNTGNTSIVKDSRYKDESLVKFYNGNLAEKTTKDGITTSYIWGYNNLLPIVKAEGVDQATLLAAYNAVSGNLSLIRNQSSLLNAHLNTYSYTPVIGMTSQTDVNGKSMTYEYDALQRLLLVRDFNYNILNQYEYKYKILPPSGSPQWITTGQTRCKPCPQNNTYITNILQQEEKDNNPASASYNTLRWDDIGVSSSCVSNADWQNTSTPIRCKKNTSNQNTGEQEQEQMDMNPCSSTYGNIQWIVVATNTTACPVPCNTSNCTGVDKKCVNNICETGTKGYTSSVYSPKLGMWVCAFYYQWSDGSSSYPNSYTEYSSATCITNHD